MKLGKTYFSGSITFDEGNNVIGPSSATFDTITVSNTLNVTGNIEGAATTASYVEFTDIANKPTLISSSNQLAGETVDGDLTVTGKLTAQEFHTEYVSGSIIYTSGSTKFGDSADDAHQFTGSLSQTSGNVGIGTVATTAHIHEASDGVVNLKLTELNAGGASQIYLENTNRTWDIGADSNPDGFYIHTTGGNQDYLFIDPNGNVGLGNTQPQYPLHVEGSIHTDQGNFVLTEGYEVSWGNGDTSILGNTTTGYLDFRTGNSTKLFLSSSGNFGIGTATPQAHVHEASGVITNMILEETSAGYAANLELRNTVDSFTISADASPNGLYFSSTLDPNSLGDSLFFVKNTGNVGIGTNSPSSKLHLYYSEETSLSKTLLTLTNYVGGDLSQQNTFIDFALVDNNANYTPQVRIGAEVGQNGDANAISKESSGAFVVHTSTGTDDAGSGNMTEKFRVDHIGRIGIGTAAPSNKLHVNLSAGTADPQYIKLSNNHTAYPTANSTTTGIRFGFYNNTYGNDWNTAEILAESPNTYFENTNLLFKTLGSGTLAERMRIEAGGNVGINTSSSDSKLKIFQDAVAQPGFRIDVNTSNRAQFEIQVDTNHSRIQTYGNGTSLGVLSLNPLGNNVAINRTTAEYPLHVNGTVMITSNDAARLILDGDNNNSEDTGQTDSIIDFLHDNEQYGYRMSVQNYGGTQSFKISDNKLGTYTDVIVIDKSNDVLFHKNTDSVDVNGVMIQAANDSAVYSSIGSPYNTYHVYNTLDNRYDFYVSYNGTIYARDVTIQSLSDERLKENIQDLTGSLDIVTSLQPRVFDFKDGSKINAKGFVAQEVEQVLPECVKEFTAGDPLEDGTRYKTVGQDFMPYIVGAIKELKAENEALKARIQALEG